MSIEADFRAMEEALKAAIKGGGSLDEDIRLVEAIPYLADYPQISAGANLRALHFVKQRAIWAAADPQYVYFLKSGEFVKIGRSKNPTARLQTYGTHNPGPMEVLLVVPEGEETEETLHLRFADLRQRGEWFRYEQPLVDYIAERKSAA